MSEKLIGILFIIVVILAFVFAIWMNFFAPCGSIDWLPAGNIPGRCFR